MIFDHPEDGQTPLTPEIAVDRALAMIRRPIRIAYPTSLAIGIWLYGLHTKALFPLMVAFVGCWLYWSYLIPRWRRWAAAKGLDPARLQQVGERRRLLWPRGSWLEKTEFR